MGRKPLRVAVCSPVELRVEQPTHTKEEARQQLGDVMAKWPLEVPRLAIAGDTGLGKTYNAVRIAAAYIAAPHIAGGIGVGQSLLIVAHNKQRVAEIADQIRAELRSHGLGGDHVQELLGRQPMDPHEGESWATRSFGCANYEQAQEYGRRRRRVMDEVCKTACPARDDCGLAGYLHHTKRAEHARVIVTTVQRLPSIRGPVWKRITAVICDEDVIGALQETLIVSGRDLRRAVRYVRRSIRSRQVTRPIRTAKKYYAPILPFMRDVAAILRRRGPKSAVPLVSRLPESCEEFLADPNFRRLRDAMPVTFRKRNGRRVPVPSPRMPAPWEAAKNRRPVRQVWGAFIDALLNDLDVPEADTCATVRVARHPRRRRRTVISIESFNHTVIRNLRARPLLVLDATLHPAACALLRLDRVDIAYAQGRKVIQALTTLHDARSLMGSLRKGLSPRGRRAVAYIAAFARGRHVLVLCRKSLKPLVEREAARYHELKRVTVVTPRSERGWDAPDDVDVFVVLGRYARPADSCAREAHALRSLAWRLDRSLAVLDDLPAPNEWTVFRGRGKPALHYGEPVERRTRLPSDPLAALIQDADRIASVVQFIGRNRTGDAWVLLLRGDPTVPLDALVDGDDLAEALPAAPESPESVEEDAASGLRPPRGTTRRTIRQALHPDGEEFLF